MAFDRKVFAGRLKKTRETLSLSLEDVRAGTEIPLSDLEQYERASADPTGDRVLILADLFRCDYRFLIDANWPDTLNNTSMLFRAFSKELSKADRFAIQETLLLCENEAFLQRELKSPVQPFPFQPAGSFFKEHGRTAAVELRQFLGYRENELKLNIFSDLRRIGFHVFRRRLCNANISGLFIDHPSAGKCIIVNFDEDVFRQRFTVAHEAGHAILDSDATYNVSFDWEGKDLKEVRANTFASHLLLPPAYTAKLPDPKLWDDADIINWAAKLMVSTHALAIGLKEHGLIEQVQFESFRMARVPADLKIDPELPASLSPAKRAAKLHAMERGLSDYYVGLAIDGFQQGQISRGRLCEMLLCDEREIAEMSERFGRTLSHGD